MGNEDIVDFLEGHNIVDLYFRERIIDYRRAKSFLQIKFYSE